MRSSVLSAVVVGFAFWVGQGISSPLPVLNPSFESPLCGATGGVGVICAPANWTLSGGTGLAGAFFPPSTAWDSIPDGVQIGWSNGGVLSQDLGVTITPDTVYTLSLWVSQRWTAGSFLPEIQLLGGSSALLTMNNSNPGGAAPTTNVDGTYNWVNWTMSWKSPSAGAILGQTLSISLSSDGAQTDFDNISLDASATPTPEPGVFGMVVAGLLGLVVRRRQVK